MRLLSNFIAKGFLALGVVVSTLGAQTANAPAVPIHAGPVYTKGDEAGAYPKYPDLQIQVEVPPSTSPELLKPEAFQVKADGGSPVIANRVQTLASTSYGVAAVVSIDVSGSMKGAPLNAIRSGLGKFVNDAGPQDKIAIQTIADDSRWDANWDDSRDQVRTSLDKLAARGRLTRLWDSLLEALQRFPATPLSQRLIVISDGHDEGSTHKEDEVITVAREHGVLVDAIGITRSNPVYLRELERLTIQTGGLFREAKDTNELERLVSSGIQRLKSTPVVSFRLDDLAGDGNPHRFEVTWKHEGAESKADVTASIPHTATSSTRARWYWGGGIAALLLLFAGIAVLRSRSRRQEPELPRVEPAPQAVSAPVAQVPPSPVRTPTVSGAPANPNPPLKPRKVTIAAEEPAPPRRVKTEIISRFPTPAKGRPAAWLFCEEGVATGKKFPLDEAEYWIGALENNHLQISDDPTVSGNHACLVFDHDVLGIYDHQSTNGTRVNGEPVYDKRRLLRPGDRIRIGRSTFAIQPVRQEGTGS